MPINPNEPRTGSFRIETGSGSTRKGKTSPILAAGVLVGLVMGVALAFLNRPAGSAVADSPAAQSPPQGDAPTDAAPTDPAPKPASHPQHRPKFHGPNAATLRADADLRGQISAIKKRQRAAAAQESASSQGATQGNTSAQDDAAGRQPGAADTTQRYWDGLNSVMEKESAARGTPLANGLNEDAARQFMQRRVASAKGAAAGIRRLSVANVDPDVVAIGERIARFYDDTQRVAQRGLNLLGSDEKTRRGAGGKSWQNDETKLADAAKTLNNDAEQVRTRMEKRYAIRFAPLK